MYVVTLSVFHNLAIWLLYVNKPEPEVDGARHSDGRAVLSQHVEVCRAVVWHKVERRVVVRNIVRGRVVDSVSYHRSVLGTCQVGHQLQRQTNLLLWKKARM